MMLREGVLTCSGAGSEADKQRRGQRGECRGHDAKIDSTFVGTRGRCTVHCDAHGFIYHLVYISV